MEREHLGTNSIKSGEEQDKGEVLDRASAKRLGASAVQEMRYDFPPIMSEEEARHWRMMQVPQTGLYKSFEEIGENCPKDLVQLVNYLDYIYDNMEDDDDEPQYAALSYATVAAYMDFGSLYDPELIQDGINNARDVLGGRDKFCLMDDDLDPIVFDLLPEKYDAKTEAIALSSALHLMHQKNPNLRDLAVKLESQLKKKLAREQGIDLNLEREVVLSTAEGDFLTGKNAFPKYLRTLVEEKIAPWRDDIFVEYQVSWMNSHLDNGDDYDYSIPESPSVIIRATNQEVAELAEKAVRSISQEEIDEAYAKKSEK